jgi:hypothetical protein
MMAHNENYFLILGLGEYKPDKDFIDIRLIGTSDNDPAVTTLIEDIIATKQREWSGWLKGPNEAKGKHFIDVFSSRNKSKRDATLSTVAGRKAHYLQAKSVIEKDIFDRLKLALHEGFILKDEITQIAKDLNISEETLKNYLGKIVIKEKEDITGHIPPRPTTHSKFKENDERMSLYGYADVYAFLAAEHIGRGNVTLPAITRINALSTQDWHDRAKEILDQLPGHNTQQEGDKNKICNFCTNDIFKSDNNRNDYDLYLEWKKIDEILKDIDKTCRIRKVLPTQLGEGYIDRLVTAGKDRDKAIKILKEFCRNKAINWASDDSEKIDTDKIACPLCNQITDSKKNICAHCSSDIRITCPACRTEQLLNTKYCSGCRFDFENIARAVKLCEDTKLALQSLDLAKAELLLNQAKSLCDTLPEISALQQKLNEKKSIYSDIDKKIQTLIEKKFYHTAKKELDDIKIKNPHYKNETIEHEIKINITMARELADKAKAANNANDKVNASKFAMSAIFYCSDFPGLETFLPKPTPVKKVSVTIDNPSRKNVVRWQADKNDFETYKIIRKVNSRAITEKDGTTLDTIAGEVYEDKDIEPGISYYYSIATCTATLSSPLVHHDTPIKNVFDVTSLTVSPHNSAIHASWSGVPQNAKVEIYRVKHTELQKKNQSDLVKNVTITEMNDTQLTNDTTYHYMIYLKYTCSTYSQGIHFSAMPTAPPCIVDQVITKHISGSSFEVEWIVAPQDQVSFYLAKELSGLKMGQTIEVQKLKTIATLVNITSNVASKGRFDLPDTTNMYYLLPVTIKNNVAVLGAVQPVSAKKIISIHSIKPSLGDVFVHFDWPTDAKAALVLCRADRYATNVDDREAKRMHLKRLQNENKAAIKITGINQSKFYISLFAEFHISGMPTYSIPDYRTYINALCEIHFEIIQSRAILTRKLQSVTLIITPPPDGSIPAIMVRAQVGKIPLAMRNQGYLITEIPQQISKKPLKVDLPQNAIKNNVYLGIFTQNEADAQHVRLIPKKGTELYIT